MQGQNIGTEPAANSATDKTDGKYTQAKKFAAWVIWLFIWTGIGILNANFHGSHFFEPLSLDSRNWTEKAPEKKHSATVGKEAYIVDGRLTLSEFTELSLTSNRKMSHVDVSLDPESGPLTLSIKTKHGQSEIHLKPNAYTVSANKDGWTQASTGGKYRLEKTASGFMLSNTAEKPLLGSPQQSKTQVQAHGQNGNRTIIMVLKAETQKALVKNIRVEQAGGGVLIEEDFSKTPTPNAIIYSGAWIGFSVGLVLMVLLQGSKSLVFGGFLSALFLMIPYLISSLPMSTWLTWVERMYLTQTTPWELARIGTFLSFIPLFCVALAHSRFGFKTMPEEPQNSNLSHFVWAFAILTASFIASWNQPNWGLAPLGIGYLALPYYLSWRNNMPNWGWFVRDLPSLIFICALGWSAGILFSAVWRLGIVAASAKALLARHSKPAVMLLFISLICIPVGMELLIRTTYLNNAWRVDFLRLEYNSDDPKTKIGAIWEDTCGGWEDKEATRIVYGGGSSTGQNQYQHKTSAFFPAETHRFLCAKHEKTKTLNSINYGFPGVDTHILAQTTGEILDRTNAKLLVLYTGVNDLLTRQHELTKREREKVMDDWRSSLGTIHKFASSSRLLIGSTLLFRKLTRSTNTVQNVPLADAKLNLERIAEVSKQKNAQLLLLTEYVRQDLVLSGGQHNEFIKYENIEEEIAKKNPHVHFLNIREKFDAHRGERLLMDTNHLTHLGYKRMAQAIGPAISEILYKDDNDGSVPLNKSKN